MLDALRRGAQTWLAKALFMILLLSFAVWGIPHDLLNFGGTYLAKVGKSEISIPEFQRSFQDQLAGLSERAGQRISTEQALAFGLDRQVLERMIAQNAVLNHAEGMQLGLSNEELVEGIKRDPGFQGPNGKFSKEGFDGFVRRLGLTEQGFLNLRRGDELRRQITEALTSSVVAPAPLVAQAYNWKNEQRVIEFVKIDAAKAAEVKEPDDAALAKYYEDNKPRFMTPEYRKVAALVLSPEEIEKEFTFTDEELKTAYEETKASYDTPERRRLQQIAFKDKAQAEETRKAIVEGKKNFVDAAKELGASESDINLGWRTQKELIDKKIAEAVFKLPRDEVSPVIEGTFTTVLVRAIEIDPGKTSTFEEMKEKVRKKLASSKAQSVIQERIDLIEEARNAGKTLKEIGEAQKLKYVETEAADRDNKTPDGKTAIEDSHAATLLRTAFQSSQGAEQPMIDLAEGAFGWIDLQGVTPPKQKTLEEAKADVKAAYLDSEKNKKLDELTTKLVALLNEGQGMARVAAEAFGTAQVSEPILRTTSYPGLTESLVKQAFALPKGRAGSGETADNSTRIVFRVSEIKPAEAPSEAQKDSVAKDLKDELRNDLLLAYIDALKEKQGVSINQSELRRATGQGREP